MPTYKTPLAPVIDARVTEVLKRAEPTSKDIFVALSVIEALRQPNNKKYDLAKVIRFCEELNSSFALGNYLAAALLIRALLNHIPPIFGQKTFEQVASQAGRSAKKLYSQLDEIARGVADLHTHSLIGYKESLPTKNQIEPFKPHLELLLQNIVAKMQEPKEPAE